MKKFLVLFLLSMVVSANAGLVIYVKLADGLWADYADSKLWVTPSTTIELGVMDLTGQTQPGSLALGLTAGPGSLDASGVVGLQGVTAMMQDDAAAAKEYGVENPFVAMEITNATSQGMLLRSVLFHCEGEGDVTVALVDDDGQIVDSQIIHQTPEPMTLALLGLGGLVVSMSRKRSA